VDRARRARGPFRNASRQPASGRLSDAGLVERSRRRRPGSLVAAGRIDADDVENLGGRLRTVVSRVCLDMLRTRQSRREEPAGHRLPDRRIPPRAATRNRKYCWSILSAGRCSSWWTPPNGSRSCSTTCSPCRSMKSRPSSGVRRWPRRNSQAGARQKVRGTPPASGAKLARQRGVVKAFLAASRAGDIDAVLAVLAPDVLRRADRATLSASREIEIRGARAVAEEITSFGRDARYPARLKGLDLAVLDPER
jgi:hypothetical protein